MHIQSAPVQEVYREEAYIRIFFHSFLLKQGGLAVYY